ncbi:MAG: hypothetical protein HY718_01130 [Planctomycetes bacterium]|nr:hypothetical protein [Planctomycetota bacterium]
MSRSDMVFGSPSGVKPADRWVIATCAARYAVAALICALVGCGGPGAGVGRSAGEEAGGPWWMRETALTRDGRLDLKAKPWWPRAAALRVGEEFTVDAAVDQKVPAPASDRQDAGPTHDRQDAGPTPAMLVRREALQRGSRRFEAIVWIIDDDGDGSAVRGGDRDSDCYVVDYDSDGVVDRMIDYIDNDGDNDPDEMDIRYFVGGELRQVWCGMDLDDDGEMWDLEAYEYSHDFFRSDPYGDSMIYMNKFDPRRGEWVAISECPFAFYDTDGDGQSEVVVRVSASPMTLDPSRDPDYANDANRYRGAWDSDMERMGISNIRYSFDIDNVSGQQTPLHYDCGFNLVGMEPYDVPGMRHYNPRRRPPQVTCVIPFDKVRQIADRYPARETGFTWHENHDDTISIGDPRHNPQDDYRWEGVFWIWERRFMENTGGPNQKWNVRREWSRKPSRVREVYHSPVDGRLHLYGAEEGWIQIGHFAGLGEIGEVRMYDTDGNGFFDRWEVYLGDLPVPVRVSSVRNDVGRRMRFDYEAVRKFNDEVVMPAAVAANEKLAGAMEAVRPFAVPEGLAAAMQAGSAGDRRYAQDVALELHYQDLRQRFTARAQAVLRQAKMNDLRGMNAEQRRTSANTQTAWAMIRLLERLDVAYGQGNVDGAAAALKEIDEIKALFAE